MTRLQKKILSAWLKLTAEEKRKVLKKIKRR